MAEAIPGSIDQQSLLRAINLGNLSILSLADDGTVVWANKEAHELFGVNQSSLVGKRWEQLIHIEGESVWNPSLDRTFEQDGQLKIDGYCDANQRGRIAIDLVMTKNGSGSGRIVLIRDITQSHAHEEALESEKRNAENLNKALEREIAKANELAVMAERANIAKSVFLTSMSHEFRTPLNGVLGYAQILRNDDSLTPKQLKAAKTIEKSGQHLLSIINDVLDLSKIEAGKVDVSKDPILLPALVSDILEVFRIRAENKGLSLELEFEKNKDGPELDWILGDTKLIRQVLLNLIGNAIKFTEAGSIRLKVEFEKKPGGDSDIILRVCVIDTGPGIDKRYLSQIFEEFYQTEAFSGHKGGTGLGLAICRKLVVAMGGELHVESELGQGSNFYFELPTIVVENASKVYNGEDDEGNLKLVSPQAAFLQLFSQDLDSGVLGNYLEIMGLQPEFKFSSIRSIDRSAWDTIPLWFVGVTASALQEPYERLKRFIGDSKGDIVFLVYMDRKKVEVPVDINDLCQKQMEVIEIPIPINFKQLQTELRKSCSAYFQIIEKEPDSHLSDLNAIGKTSESIATDVLPKRNVLEAMMFDAQIGDTRSLSQKLEAWTDDVDVSSEFETKVKQLMDAFRMDDLCRYFDRLLEEEK